MNFDRAIKECMKGKRVCRMEWNGKDMWLYIEEGKTIPFESLREPIKSWIGKDMVVNTHFNLKTADGSISIGWIPTQMDIFADDWVVIV